MDNTQRGNVDININRHIAVITFSHPAHNSLPGKLLAELAGTITETGKRDDVRVIILRSGGDRTFCAGASFDEMVAIDDEVTGKAFFMGFANVINACRKCPKLIIGRVQGKAVGGGVGVASATDYCYATKFASVKLSELAVGIGPFVVGPAIERKVGTAALSQMGINARAWHSAQWAYEKGLFAEVHNTAEEMDEAIESLASDLARSNPEAMELMKKAFWRGTDDWDQLLEQRAEMSGRLVLSDFAREAINRFKNKS